MNGWGTGGKGRRGKDKEGKKGKREKGRGNQKISSLFPHPHVPNPNVRVVSGCKEVAVHSVPLYKRGTSWRKQIKQRPEINTRDENFQTTFTFKKQLHKRLHFNIYVIMYVPKPRELAVCTIWLCGPFGCVHHLAVWTIWLCGPFGVTLTNSFEWCFGSPVFSAWVRKKTSIPLIDWFPDHPSSLGMRQ